MIIVCDTNKLFSSILDPSSKISEFIFTDDYTIKAAHFSIVELFKHKEKLFKLANKSEAEMLEIFYHVISNVEFFNEKFISDNSKSIAYELCKEIDPKDTIFVALALELNAPLWTGDKKLIKALHAKGFTNFFDDSI